MCAVGITWLQNFCYFYVPHAASFLGWAICNSRSWGNVLLWVSLDILLISSVCITLTSVFSPLFLTGIPVLSSWVSSLRSVLQSGPLPLWSFSPVCVIFQSHGSSLYFSTSLISSISSFHLRSTELQKLFFAIFSVFSKFRSYCLLNHFHLFPKVSQSTESKTLGIWHHIKTT